MQIDRHYIARFPGKARAALHRVRRVLEARRNGVVTFFSAVSSGQGRKTLEVSARNTRPDKIEVSRKLMIGPRGGLFKITNGKRRYLKARDLGRKWA